MRNLSEMVRSSFVEIGEQLKSLRAERTTLKVPLPQGHASGAQSPIEPHSTLNASLIKEASKKVYSFPDSYKLVGPSNFDQWKQALTIMLRAMDYAIFIDNPSTADSLIGAEQALLLMLLRDSLTAILANSIAWL